jgi:hypothetical protein
MRAEVVIALLSCVTTFAAAQTGPKPLELEDLIPIVVPVTLGEVPYSSDVLWRAFSDGDTVSEEYRLKYAGRACENVEFFLKRQFSERSQCRALELTPWLRLPHGTSDKAIVATLLAHIDSSLKAAYLKDSLRDFAPVIVAVVGRPGPPQLLLNRSTNDSTGPRRQLRSVVFLGLPADSAAITEETFVLALPLALGLPAGSLLRDTEGHLFLHPDARLRLSRDSANTLAVGDTASLDATIYQCGSMSCIAVSHVQRIALPHSSAVLYLSVRYGEGILLERVGPLASSGASQLGVASQVFISPSTTPTRLDSMGRVFKNAGDPYVLITWSKEIARISVPGSVDH